jgi:AraC family transcriptional regulator
MLARATPRWSASRVQGVIVAFSSLHDLPISNVPRQVLASCPATVAGLSISVMPIPSHAELRDDVHPNPRIFVAQQGLGRRWYSRGGVTRPLRTAPRMIEIYEQGVTFDREVWEGTPGRCVVVEFRNHDVETLTHGRLRSLELKTRHEVFDDRVSRLALAIGEETVSGLPNGRLYVQGLCIALLGLLSARYSARAQDAGAQNRRLSAQQEHRVVEQIRSQLASKLSLATLAHEVGLSPQHFARLFRASFGTTPHAFVQAARIDAAVEALRRERATPIAAIAAACGFSSQSHMTELMRQRLGATPSQVRRGLSAVGRSGGVQIHPFEE